MTDSLRLMGENIAVVGHRNGADGRYITVRYYDVIHPKPEETRASEEIIAQIRAKLGGERG